MKKIVIVLFLLLSLPVHAADWSKPTLSDTYTNFLGYLNARLNDLAVGVSGTSTNLPTGTIRWNSVSNKWEKWTGAAWTDLAASNTYGINISGSAADSAKLGGLTPSSTPGASQVVATDSFGQIRLSTTPVVFLAGASSNATHYAGNTHAVLMGTSTSNLATNAYVDIDGVYHYRTSGPASLAAFEPTGVFTKLTAASGSAGATIPWTGIYPIWSADNDGAASGLDADLLDGKHWVNISGGSTGSIASGASATVNLRSGGTLRHYRVSVYPISGAYSSQEGTAPVPSCTTCTHYYIAHAPSGQSDRLVIVNDVAGYVNFAYTVDVWE